MFLILAATTLLSAPAHATTPPASPLQTGSGSSGATTVRERCSTCRTSSADRYREKLLLQIDSLRWQIENKRMSDEERRRTVSELSSTIRALQQSLDESTRGGTVSVAVEAATAGEAIGRAPMAIARLPMRARGYLGVTFDGPSAEIARPGDYSVRFYKYPRIALVEPSSPAERAGVLEGDTLMSFNGTDVVENEISLSKLLVPEAKILMRVRRSGNSKELKVTVGEPPEYYVRRRDAEVRAEIAAAPTPWVVGAGPTRVAQAAPPAVAAEPVTVIWQDYDGIALPRPSLMVSTRAPAIGVKEGVLVMRVRPGTPAAKAGLRDGDVIVRAGGQRIRTVPELRSVFSMGDPEEGVKLLIRRDRKEKDVTLRW